MGGFVSRPKPPAPPKPQPPKPIDTRRRVYNVRTKKYVYI